MDRNRVRIDAYLHPVPAVGPTPITSLQKRFGRGDFDHLDVERVASSIGRAALLDLSSFNARLNAMLRQYGLWVVNVADHEIEYALEYSDNWSMYHTRQCLTDAKAMRDWFLPAASVSHQVDEDHLEGVEWLLDNSVSFASMH